jgi:Na+/H+ antiporter NhaD/arsenite permease-like protein
MNFVTSPLIADLFLLAITAIGRDEVKGGTIGANGIVPYDIMLFFLSLAYIAISVDASGLIRWLAFKVLQKGGKVGHRLYFFLYLFFFALTAFIGNDPIILSGTAFLSYMTRVSSNITHPRAWIFTQFACANIASAILVSSNPTNLVLAGAFQITFIKYTANVIVPVIVTGVILFPFLLYIIFQDENLIPNEIEMEDLPEHIKNQTPVNPNIPFAKDESEDQVDHSSDTEDQKNRKQLSLEEILNPFLDKKGAIFGAGIMAATLITVLIINAVAQGTHETPVFYVTLPAAFVLIIFDLGLGWSDRKKTRKIAREGRKRAAMKKEEKERREKEEREMMPAGEPGGLRIGDSFATGSTLTEKTQTPTAATLTQASNEKLYLAADQERDAGEADRNKASPPKQPTTLESIIKERYQWAEETFPTTMTVFNHLPLALLPFAFCMFVLVQALVTKGWVPVFAHGWDHWVEKTGTVGAVGGMGFLSVVLCNVSIVPYRSVRDANSLATVCWHKHRHYDFALACRSILAGDPPPERQTYLRSNVLGHSVQHGYRRQLWSLQSGVQRVPCWHAVARYSGTQTHPCRWSRICTCQLAYHCHYHGGRFDRTDWPDLHHEGYVPL